MWKIGPCPYGRRAISNQDLQLPVGVDLPLSVEANVSDLMSLKDQSSLTKEFESSYDSFMRIH